MCVLQRQGMGWRGGWGGEGESSTVEGCEKNTQAHTPAIQINFKAEVEEFLYQWAQGSSFGEEQVHRSREGRNNQSQRKNRKKNSSGFQLANKKAKQSIMSESPHSWLLLPGSGRMKWDKTRICKLIRSLWTAGEKRWWWWWGSEKINGHSRGRHKGLLKVYCHKH